MSWVLALKSGDEVMLGVLLGDRWVVLGTVRRCWVVVGRFGCAMAIFSLCCFCFPSLNVVCLKTVEQVISSGWCCCVDVDVG